MCNTDYHWEAGTPCGGNTPACSNGTCGSVRLVGGIVTVADGVLSANGIRLVDHGLEFMPTSCGDVKGVQICVTGGIRP
jgi:hypothetical protein